MTNLFSSPTCFTSDTVVGSQMLPAYAIFLFLAVVSVIVIRKAEKPKTRIALVYIHLAALFMPIVLLSTNSACGFTCNSCHNNLPLLVVYSVPIAAIATTFAGLVLIPKYYTLRSNPINSRWIKKFTRKRSEVLKIRVPEIRLYHSQMPLAFSFSGIKSAIFISIGALEVFTKKELQAVILHELAHIRGLDSVNKLSRKTMMLSPFYKIAGFGDSTEEKEADTYAIKMQKTSRYIKNARKKLKYLK